MPSLRDHWRIDPEIAYLNHGSFGACPTAVLETQSELRARMEHGLVLFLARELEGLLDEAREPLASFIGAEAQDVAFVSNATSGVNAVLRSMELSPGDEILVTNHGYNACNNAVDFATERAGAKTVVAEVPFPLTSKQDVIDAVLEKVTPRTRLALLDHITSATGIVFPIQDLIAALSERGIETLVDAAHAPGMLELDVAAWNPAYYTGNCHKWICAPKGAAFLWVRRDLQPTVRPAVISHGANSERPGRSRYLQEFDWTGTQDPTPWLAIPKALEVMGSLFEDGWNGLRRHNKELLLQGRALVLEALGTAPPVPDSMLGSLASLLLPADPGSTTAPGSAFEVDPLQARLFDHHHIEVPIMWSSAAGQRLIRLSAQAYNEPGEFERLAVALA